MRTTAIILAAVLAGCASPPVYYPVDAVVVASDAGPNALAAEIAPRFAGVVAVDKPDKVSELRVQLEVANRSVGPVTLDLTDCALEEPIAGRRHRLSLATQHDSVLVAPLAIAPGDVQDVRLTFTLPHDFDYDEMPAFRVRVRLAHAGKATIAVLRFNRYRRPDVVYAPGWYYPYPAYCYPGSYFSTSVGLGFSFGR